MRYNQFPFNIEDDHLAEVIVGGEVEDLNVLVDHITDKGEGRISLSSDTCVKLVKSKERGEYDNYARLLIAEEISKFGGNSFVNILRGGKGVGYLEIATDVSKRLKVKSASINIDEIEENIIKKVLAESALKMSSEELSSFLSSIGVASIGAVTASSVTAVILGLNSIATTKATAALASATLTSMGIGIAARGGAIVAAPSGANLLLGPVGWAFAAIWTVYDLASPAYRVTLPCVIHIAHMRRKKVKSSHCKSCGFEISSKANFCPECGSKQVP